MPPLPDVNYTGASPELAAAVQTALAANMRVRGTVLMACRDAALSCFGELGLAQLGAHLSDAARRDTVEVAAASLNWMPEAYVLEWYEALWLGPCDKRRDLFLRFLDRMIDAGFGRIRKTLVALATPSMILNKAPSLWEHDHSHGQLQLVALDEGSARVSLSTHPYVETSLSRLATAEIYRYCLSLCRVRDVVEVHYREPNGALVVCLRWSP